MCRRLDAKKGTALCATVPLSIQKGAHGASRREDQSRGKSSGVRQKGTSGRNRSGGGKLYFSGRALSQPGYCGEIIYLYLCTVSGMGRVNPDEDEFIEAEAVPLDKAVEMVLNNEIGDAKTQTAVLKTAALLQHGKYEMK